MKVRVIKCGCYGRINGAVSELPVGHEFNAQKIPIAFEGRVIVLDQQASELEDKKKKGR